MPVFIIGLLNGFILNPMLYKMSCLWSEQKKKAFIEKTLLLSLTVLVITVICIAGAYICGIPVLSWLYNTDLSLYKMELLILLVGGGFLGLSGVLNAVLTIIRCQNALLVGYAMVAVLAFFMSDSFVQRYGMMGASVLYAGLMAILCVIFIVAFVIGITFKKKS